MQDAAANTVTHQYIKFLATGQEFAADIMSVREIRGWTQATVVPHAPDYVLGNINLRGVVLPVVDLKARLGMGFTEPSPSHVIIVMESGPRLIGILVEAVLDILSVADTQIQPMPDLVREVRNDYIDGVAVLDGKMVTLLEINKLTAEVGALN